MLTLELIQRITDISSSGEEAAATIRACSSATDLERATIRYLINTVNRATSLCWDDTNGALLQAYGTEALTYWTKLSTLVGVLVTLTGTVDVLNQVQRPAKIAVLCQDGYVLNSKFDWDPEFPGLKWHVTAPSKEAGLALIAQGEVAVRTALATNNGLAYTPPVAPSEA